MKREGFDVARCTIERLMRETGLNGAIRGRPFRTRISDKAAPGNVVIGPTGAVKVMVATRPVDFRNYVERLIMRSPQRQCPPRELQR